MPLLLSHLCYSFCPSLSLSSAGAVRASSIFPILSVILLFMGGLCIAASEFYKTRHNIILSAGIFFVSAGKGMRRVCCPGAGLQGLGGCPARTSAGAQLPRQECVHFPALVSLIQAESSVTKMTVHAACSPGRGRQGLSSCLGADGGRVSLKSDISQGAGVQSREGAGTGEGFWLSFPRKTAHAGRDSTPQPPPLPCVTFLTSPSLSPAGWLAGLSNIIGIIVYISANAGDPSKSDSKKNSYSYGWSFYFGALSFIIAEMVGVLAVHMFIDRHKQLRANARATDYLQSSAITRIPSYRYRYQRRSRSSSRSTEPSHSRDASPVGIKGFNTLPSTEISMYTLTRDPLKATTTPTATYNSDRDNSFLQVHNCIQKENKDSIHTNTANRRTTPV